VTWSWRSWFFLRDKRTVSLFAAFALLPGFLILFSVSVSASLWAVDDDYQLQRNRLQLNRVIKQLMAEKKALRKTKGEEQGLLTDLDAIDQKLANTGKRLDFLARQRERAENDLPRWAEEIRTGRLLVAEMRMQLKSHLRLMYGLGGQGVVKVAFSQEDSARVRQSVLYYGRLIKSRNAKFRIFQDSIQKLNQSVLEHQNLVKKVEELSDQLMAEREQELEHREQRAALLDNLRLEKELHQQKVEELTIARSSLTSFMEKLSGALASTPDMARSVPDDVSEFASVPSPVASPKQNFVVAEAERYVRRAPEPRRKYRKKIRKERKITQNKGRLSAPVSVAGQTRKPGLFFRISQNSPVKAVHRAQVVYADWFRGYGQLVILNHGDNIYSLYGHNKKLLVTPGDWVQTNQTIARTGDTGSLEGIPGLYFEIRRRGQAENPKRWLASSR
jgi:murein hydrolase activator